jgi:two-component system chemotaxis sensor kinase CheA
VRNTLDHGIEEPEERERRGKAPSGLLRVSAATRGDRVEVTVEDDGRGIDVGKVREAARARGRKPPRDAREALELIFEPGFSTQARTTAISGRGVGLDVVRTRARELKGEVTVASEPGRGAAFRIELPLTLALSRLLLVEAGSEVFALPMEAVAKVLLVPAASLERMHGVALARDDGALVPLAPLAPLVGREAAPTTAEDELPIVVLHGDRPTGLLVDAVIDAVRGTVRPIGVAAGRLCASALVLADGRPVPVLSPTALRHDARELWGRPSAAPSGGTGKARILLADDARTTRDILRHILETAGYDVTPCEDGEEALAALERGDFAAVVSDVEMPRRNGLELTRAVRAHPRHARIPVILVTTLGAETERRRGLEAGASAYLTKSAFRQEGLLDTLARLLGEVSS